jgi:hypothetical protein
VKLGSSGTIVAMMARPVKATLAVRNVLLQKLSQIQIQGMVAKACKRPAFCRCFCSCYSLCGCDRDGHLTNANRSLPTGGHAGHRLKFLLQKRYSGFGPE